MESTQETQRILIDQLRDELDRAQQAGEFEARSEVQDVRGYRVPVPTRTAATAQVDRIRDQLDRMEGQGRSTVVVPRGRHIRESLTDIESDNRTTMLVNGDGFASEANLAREVREDQDAAAKIKANPEPSPFAPALEEQAATTTAPAGPQSDAEKVRQAREDAIARRTAAQGRETPQDGPTVEARTNGAAAPRGASERQERTEATISGGVRTEPEPSDEVARRYGLEARTAEDRSVTYHRDGQEVMTDHGDRIDLHGEDERNYAAAVSLAGERFPKGIEIHVADEAKRNAILDECARQGVNVSNPELAEQYAQLREKYAEQNAGRENNPFAPNEGEPRDNEITTEREDEAQRARDEQAAEADDVQDRTVVAPTDPSLPTARGAKETMLDSVREKIATARAAEPQTLDEKIAALQAKAKEATLRPSVERERDASQEQEHDAELEM